MPLLTITDSQRDAEIARAAELAAVERMIWRERLVVLLLVMAWQVAGLGFMVWAMASRDPVRAQGMWVLGPAIGWVGAGLTLLAYYVRLNERGDL